MNPENHTQADNLMTLRKSVLITGATRGIGLEAAKQLSQNGLFVYLGSRNLREGNAIVSELTEMGFKISRPLK